MELFYYRCGRKTVLLVVPYGWPRETRYIDVHRRIISANLDFWSIHKYFISFYENAIACLTNVYITIYIYTANLPFSTLFYLLFITFRFSLYSKVWLTANNLFMGCGTPELMGPKREIYFIFIQILLASSRII